MTVQCPTLTKLKSRQTSVLAIDPIFLSNSLSNATEDRHIAYELLPYNLIIAINYTVFIKLITMR